MTSLRLQLELAQKRISILEAQIKALESICLGRISPSVFRRSIEALAGFVSTKELVDILVCDKDEPSQPLPEPPKETL